MRKITGGLLCLFILAGCGSAYQQAGSLGVDAQQYTPAVLVHEGNQARYDQVLPICRQAAINRSMTAAQEAQLQTLTQTATSTVEGAAAAVEFGNMFDVIGDVTGMGDVNMGEQALVGAGVGLVTGLVTGMASGAQETADETRRILLNCLRAASNHGEFWEVLE